MTVIFKLRPECELTLILPMPLVIAVIAAFFH
jgi:hypothetical protein